MIRFFKTDKARKKGISASLSVVSENDRFSRYQLYQRRDTEKPPSRGLFVQALNLVLARA